MAKLRYGIIGTGGAGQGKHLTSYAQNPDVEIIAVCDIIAEKANQAADRFNVEAAYTDYNEMLREEKLDLVSVATPTRTRRRLSRRCRPAAMSTARSRRHHAGAGAFRWCAALTNRARSS